MKNRAYYLTLTGYIVLISTNVAIVDDTPHLAKELLPIWIPWISIWIIGTLGAFWLHTVFSARKPKLRYAVPLIYAILAITFATTATGQDWLARLVPMNALIALTIASFTQSLCSPNSTSRT